jgi:ribosome maturation factor RimP
VRWYSLARVGRRAHFFLDFKWVFGSSGFSRSGRDRTAEVYAPVLVLTLHPVARKVAELLEAHIERQGYELVSVEFRRGGRQSMLRLLVDRPGGGIGLDDLERLSPMLGDLLDVYDPIEGHYTLEVASPGINRPLAKMEHFEAYCGKRVRVRLLHARDGQRVFVGTLVAANPTGVEVDDESSGRRHAFGFDEIEGANYEYDFGD